MSNKSNLRKEEKKRLKAQNKRIQEEKERRDEIKDKSLPVRVLFEIEEFVKKNKKKTLGALIVLLGIPIGIFFWLSDANDAVFDEKGKQINALEKKNEQDKERELKWEHEFSKMKENQERAQRENVWKSADIQRLQAQIKQLHTGDSIVPITYDVTNPAYSFFKDYIFSNEVIDINGIYSVNFGTPSFMDEPFFRLVFGNEPRNYTSFDFRKSVVLGFELDTTAIDIYWPSLVENATLRTLFNEKKIIGVGNLKLYSFEINQPTAIAKYLKQYPFFITKFDGAKAITENEQSFILYYLINGHLLKRYAVALSNKKDGFLLQSASLKNGSIRLKEGNDGEWFIRLFKFYEN